MRPRPSCLRTPTLGAATQRQPSPDLARLTGRGPPRHPSQPLPPIGTAVEAPPADRDRQAPGRAPLRAETLGVLAAAINTASSWTTSNSAPVTFLTASDFSVTLPVTATVSSLSPTTHVHPLVFRSIGFLI